MAEIEDFVNGWVWSIVGDLENGGQAASEHMDQLFEGSRKSCIIKRIKIFTMNCVKYIMHVGNTKKKTSSLNLKLWYNKIKNEWYKLLLNCTLLAGTSNIGDTSTKDLVLIRL